MIVRCAKCGSKNVIVNEKNDGYDLKKGAIGVALLGTGGAVMGVNGKNQKFYHCQECGTTLPYPMAEFTAKKIDEYLNAPAVYKSLLDIDKKMYPNIEWENPDAKKQTFKTNDDLADALYEYMEKQNIYVISRKDVDSLFELDKYGIVNSFDACWILVEDKGMKYYQDEIDDEIQYFYFIPKNYYKEISDLVLKKIKSKKEVRISDLRDDFNNFIVQKFIGFTQDEKFMKNISEQLQDDITDKKYVMYDNSELYGYVTGDLKYIPYEEDYKSFKKNALNKKKNNEDKISDYIMNLITNEGIKNNDILDKITPKLLKDKIVENEEEAHYIINRMLMDEYEKSIQIKFNKDKSNPIIKLLTDEEKEKILLEEKQEEKKRKLEEKRIEKEREKLEKKKKEEEEKKQDRRMKDLSFQYFSEIERLLKYEPGQYVASLYKKSAKLKELSPTNLDELSNLMKYLVKIGKCGSFKINGSGAIYYYINDDVVNVEEIKAKRQQEHDDLQNSLNNNRTTHATTNSNGCYVATCVYGSYDCPQVWTLRRFRDNYLDNYILGRMFIKLYYAISPTIVNFFGKNKIFVSFNKNILDRLIIKLKSKGYKDTKYNDKY